MYFRNTLYNTTTTTNNNNNNQWLNCKMRSGGVPLPSHPHSPPFFPPSPPIRSRSFLSHPFPSPSLPPSPYLLGFPNPLIWLGGLPGLGEHSSSPSWSRRSPAARRFLVHFRLKRTLLVITILKEVSYQSTVELSRQRLFYWQY